MAGVASGDSACSAVGGGPSVGATVGATVETSVGSNVGAEVGWVVDEAVAVGTRAIGSGVVVSG